MMSSNATVNRLPARSTNNTTADSGRRERKRAVDRVSQRTSRARTKSYIALLENTVEGLKRGSPSETISALVKQLKKQHEEIERLKGLLNGIGRLVNDATAKESSSLLPNAYEEVTSLSEKIPDTAHNVNQPLESDADVILCSDPRSDNTSIRHCQYPPVPQGDLSTKDNGEELLNTLKCGEGNRNYFEVLSNALTIAQSISRSIPLSLPEDDEDLVIRAVLESWTATKQRHTLDAIWKLLEAVDKGLYWRSGKVERVAILRMMRALLLQKIKPLNQSEREVPRFMDATNAQLLIGHATLIDYFIWPEFRDILILKGVDHTPEAVVLLFASQIYLDWPFQLKDICLQDRITKNYSYSSAFTDCYNNLKSWQVGPLFAQRLSTSLRNCLEPYVRNKTTFPSLSECNSESRSAVEDYTLEPDSTDNPSEPVIDEEDLYLYMYGSESLSR